MTSWIRDLENNRLVRSEPGCELEPEPEPNPELEVSQKRSLSNIFYLPRTALQSCFVIPNLAPNVTFELKLHYT